MGLYERLNYKIFNNRRLYLLPVEYRPIKPIIEEKIISISRNNDVKLIFRRLSSTEAKTLLEQFYNKQNLAPVNMDDIIQLESFRGCYIVESEDKNTMGGICLERTSNDNFMGLAKVFVSTVYYMKHWFNALILALFSLLFLYFFGNLQKDSSAAATIMFFFLVWLCIWGYLKLLSLLKYFSGYEERGRYFAPFYIGNNYLKPHVMKFLFESMSAIANLQNIRTIKINYEDSDSMSEFYPNKPAVKITRFRQLFMGKRIRNNTQDSNLHEYHDTFFDPRDL